MSGKILLAVSDNGANVTKPMKDLGWKHFGCYAHTLNLAVQDALSATQEMIDLVSKGKPLLDISKDLCKPEKS